MNIYSYFKNLIYNIDLRRIYFLVKFKSNILNFNKTFDESKKLGSNNDVILCGIAKNEDDYIEEWVTYHLELGFDKIVIYDNNDGYQLHNILRDYIMSGKVDIVDFKEKDKSIQFKAYNTFLESYSFHYCAFNDIDEFISLKIHDDIKEFLKEYSDYDCIYLNWMIFGTNGQKVKKKGLVRERFSIPALPLERDINNLAKPIIKGDKYSKFDITPHDPYVSKGFYANTGGKSKRNPFHSQDYRIAYIEHYPTKSEEELMKKIERGYPYEDSKINKFDEYIKVALDFPFKPLFEVTDDKNDDLLEKIINNNVGKIHINNFNKELLLNLFKLSNMEFIVHIDKYPPRKLFVNLLNYCFVNNNVLSLTFSPIDDVEDDNDVFIIKN